MQGLTSAASFYLVRSSDIVMNLIHRPVPACLVHRSVVSQIHGYADKLDLLWATIFGVSFATSATLFVVNEL
ncbi:hypothetical protein VN97_g11983 [Penicillium thymicola]|uniref:Uncharacterized protein n=1 Tax=Penicillium thymicola TaxID=293382 RepID=A0AAI9T6A0_PENTH|nr:hypothetical protein VN97_g11983 [Penicillium thymicola]